MNDCAFLENALWLTVTFNYYVHRFGKHKVEMLNISFLPMGLLHLLCFTDHTSHC